MIDGRLCRADDHACLIPSASKTSNMFERMRGLLGRPQLGPSQALLIRPCASVHTLGMRYPIDLAFLDREWTIIKTVKVLKPWRMAACPTAAMVIELLAGSLERLQMVNGLQLRWQDQ